MNKLYNILMIDIADLKVSKETFMSNNKIDVNNKILINYSVSVDMGDKPQRILFIVRTGYTINGATFISMVLYFMIEFSPEVKIETEGKLLNREIYITILNELSAIQKGIYFSLLRQFDFRGISFPEIDIENLADQFFPK